MNLFQFCNLFTVYSCEGTLNIPIKDDCCFHTITKDKGERIMNNLYSIRLCRSNNLIKDHSKNNFCPFTYEQVEEYLKYIQHIYPFEYTILTKHSNIYDLSEEDLNNREGDEEEEDIDYDIVEIDVDYFDLNIRIDGALIYHKFILKLIRALYEFPFNYILNDILLIKEKVPSLAKYGFINLYNYIGNVFHHSITGALSDQFISEFFQRNIVNFISIGKLKDKLNEVSEFDIDDQDVCEKVMTYHGLDTDVGLILDNIPNFRELFKNSNVVYNYDYWKDEEMFNKRVQIYTEFINKVK